MGDPSSWPELRDPIFWAETADTLTTIFGGFGFQTKLGDPSFHAWFWGCAWEGSSSDHECVIQISHLVWGIWSPGQDWKIFWRGIYDPVFYLDWAYGLLDKIGGSRLLTGNGWFSFSTWIWEIRSFGVDWGILPLVQKWVIQFSYLDFGTLSFCTRLWDLIIWPEMIDPAVCPVLWGASHLG